MIQPLALYIGLRYTRAKRRNHFISFISLASMLGIAVGVAVLITVLSVMNGFDYQIRNRFFALAPQVTIFTNSDISKTWPQLAQHVKTLPEVESVAPFTSGNGLFIRGNQIYGLQVVGIDPHEEQSVSKIKQTIVAGDLSSLRPGTFRIILGKSLANSMGMKVGDSVNLFTPQINMTLAGTFPRYRRFTVTGIFEASNAFGFENSVAFINLNDAQKLYPSGLGVNGLHVKLKNIYQAQLVTHKLQKMLPSGFAITNWTIDAGAFFQALVMEKIVLFIILLLIVAVAAFNLVSTLVMAVNDKQADIAILRTLGASPHTIMAAFVIQGAIIGLVGTLLGIVSGIILSLNITQLANAIQNFFHIQLLSSAVFFVDYLPSKLQMMDVLYVAIAAFVLSLLATIYPALIAFKTQPAEALRYE